MRFVPGCALDPDGVKSYIVFGELKKQGRAWPGGITLQLLAIRAKSKGSIGEKGREAGKGLDAACDGGWGQRRHQTANRERQPGWAVVHGALAAAWAEWTCTGALPSARPHCTPLELTVPCPCPSTGLKAADPFINPAININYFSDPADLATLVNAVKMARKIAAQEPLKKYLQEVRLCVYTERYAGLQRAGNCRKGCLLQSALSSFRRHRLAPRAHVVLATPPQRAPPRRRRSPASAPPATRTWRSTSAAPCTRATRWWAPRPWAPRPRPAPWCPPPTSRWGLAAHGERRGGCKYQPELTQTKLASGAQAEALVASDNTEGRGPGRRGAAG